MNRRPVAGELCYGVRAIAEHLGVKPRQALRLVELKRIPHWREGRVVCSSKGSLSTWLTEREARDVRLNPLERVPSGELRDRLARGDEIAFGHAADALGVAPMFTISFDGAAFTVRSAGRVVTIASSWSDAADAALGTALPTPEDD